MADKQERWEVFPEGKRGMAAVIRTGGIGGELVCDMGVDKETAEQIIALHNAALDIGDPTAVAENMYKAVSSLGELCRFVTIGPVTKEYEQAMRRAKENYATITKPKGD